MFLVLIVRFSDISYLGQTGADLCKAARNDDVESMKRTLSPGFDPNIYRVRSNLAPI